MNNQNYSLEPIVLESVYMIGFIDNLLKLVNKNFESKESF